MKAWGFFGALLLGAVAGWLAQQFWNVERERSVLEQANVTSLAKTGKRLQNLRSETGPAPVPVLSNGSVVQVTEEDVLVRLTNAGALDQAYQTYRSSPENYLVNSQLVQKLAEAYIAREQYLEAMTLLYEHLALLSGDAEEDFHAYIARTVEMVDDMLAGKYQFDQLVELYQSLIGLKPEYVPYSLRLAGWQIELGEYDAAENALMSARHDISFSEAVQKLERQIQLREQLQAQETFAIPLLRDGRHFTLDVGLASGDTASLMLDTGASLTVLKQDWIEGSALVLPQGERVTMKTANGLTEGWRTRVSALQLGSINLNDVEVGVMPLKDFKHDGLLGMNVLGEFQFFIDQQNNTLYLK